MWQEVCIPCGSGMATLSLALIAGQFRPFQGCNPFCARASSKGRPVTKCMKHGSGAKSLKGKTRSQQPRTQAKQASQTPRNKLSAPANLTLTPPMKVQVEAQLANLEQAANPWWSTFCGITNGVWLGQTAAFAPSTGMTHLSAVAACMPMLLMHTCNVICCVLSLKCLQYLTSWWQVNVDYMRCLQSAVDLIELAGTANSCASHCEGLVNN